VVLVLGWSWSLVGPGPGWSVPGLGLVKYESGFLFYFSWLGPINDRFLVDR
jgi:hypothetical protein